MMPLPRSGWDFQVVRHRGTYALVSNSREWSGLPPGQQNLRSLARQGWFLVQGTARRYRLRLRRVVAAIRLGRHIVLASSLRGRREDARTWPHSTLVRQALRHLEQRHGRGRSSHHVNHGCCTELVGFDHSNARDLQLAAFPFRVTAYGTRGMDDHGRMAACTRARRGSGTFGCAETIRHFGGLEV